MRPIVFFTFILLVATACKKSPITQTPAVDDHSDMPLYVPTPAPMPSSARIDTFIGTLKTWTKTDPHTELYVTSNRGYTHIFGTVIENSWAHLPNHLPYYQIKNNTKQTSITLHKADHEEFWVYIACPNDSLIIDWYYSEELFAKGPTGGVHTTKQASFAGKRK